MFIFGFARKVSTCVCKLSFKLVSLDGCDKKAWSGCVGQIKTDSAEETADDGAVCGGEGAANPVMGVVEVECSGL